MKTLDIVSWVLIIIGALNWGLVGLAEFDLVAFLFGMEFGEASLLSRIIYGLVGLAGLYEVVAIRAIRHRWEHRRTVTA